MIITTLIMIIFGSQKFQKFSNFNVVICARAFITVRYSKWLIPKISKKASFFLECTKR